jgi:hypothetical protein
MPLAVAEYEATDLWEAYRTRRLRSVYAEAAAAMDADPTKADTILAGARDSLDALDSEHIATKLHLPEVQDVTDFTKIKLENPPQLIWGVLHRGCKLAIGGGSKTFKTWTLLDMGLSVSHDKPWLSFKTTRSRVCYINLELPEWSIQHRLMALAKEKGITMQQGWLEIWNLRGYATTYTELLPIITQKLTTRNISLLIIDPVYKLYGNTDENSARDVSALLNGLERVTQKTGASIAFAAHFSKGNQASKQAIDRISGSGVFARDPDAIITFTKHEENNAYVIDATLRNCKTIEPFVVRWEYPLMRRDDELDPSKLKQTKPGGRVPTFTVPMILACLGKRKLTSAQWQKRCGEEGGITRATFYRLLADADKFKLASKDGKDKWSVSKVSNPPSETSETHKSQNT